MFTFSPFAGLKMFLKGRNPGSVDDCPTGVGVGVGATAWVVKVRSVEVVRFAALSCDFTR